MSVHVSVTIERPSVLLWPVCLFKGHEPEGGEWLDRHMVVGGTWCKCARCDLDMPEYLAEHPEVAENVVIDGSEEPVFSKDGVAFMNYYGATSYYGAWDSSKSMTPDQHYILDADASSA